MITAMALSGIIILICYYGKAPWYFPFFLHSCKYNSTIDFLIFSDISYDGEIPPNVTMLNMSMDEIKEIAETKLGFSVAMDTPYKLCDFKPAYGYIFSDYTRGYDFWGQSDIDIIYGNIRGFMTEDVLSKYDFISMRHDYTTGCFALYRNNTLMNGIFKRSRDFELVFTSSRHLCFDECNFVQDLLTAGKSIFEINTNIESFTHVIKSAEKNNEIRAHFDFILMEGLPGYLRYDKGKVIYKNTYEAILYHLFWLKRVYTPDKIWRKIPESYRISAKRIYI